jgi:hypothetical protein
MFNTGSIYNIGTILIFSCFIVVEASAGLSILTLISRSHIAGFPQGRLIFSPDLDFLRGALVILTAWLLVFMVKAILNSSFLFQLYSQMVNFFRFNFSHPTGNLNWAPNYLK